LSLLAFWLAAAAATEAEEGGGSEGGSLTAPSGLSVYEYSAGSRFGIQWTIGDATADTELYRDDVLYTTVGAGVSTVDIGLKSGDGSHTWKARHTSGASASAFSASLTTLDGFEV
jgi:hypothetical protein